MQLLTLTALLVAATISTGMYSIILCDDMISLQLLQQMATSLILNHTLLILKE